MQQLWEHFQSQVLAWYIPQYLGTGASFHWVCGADRVPSANEGSVALMTFTFPLFTVGFLIPGFVHIMIGWAARAPKEWTFASQRFWSYITL